MNKYIPPATLHRIYGSPDTTGAASVYWSAQGRGPLDDRPVDYIRPRFVDPAEAAWRDRINARLNGKPRHVRISPSLFATFVRKQQDRLRAAVRFISAGNSELEPDDRQIERSRSTDRQGSQGQGFGGRTAFLASGLQRGERHVRGQISDQPVTDAARGHEPRAADDPSLFATLAADARDMLSEVRGSPYSHALVAVLTVVGWTALLVIPTLIGVGK